MGLLALLLQRVCCHDAHWTLVVVNAFTLYYFLAAWPVAFVAAWRRRWLLAGLAAALCAWHLTLVVPPLLERSPPPANGQTIRMVSANLFFINDRPDALAEEIERVDANLLVLQEISPLWEAALARRGWQQRYPHRVVSVREDAFGAGIFSKEPFVDSGTFLLAERPQHWAIVEIGGLEVLVVDIHTWPPKTPDMAVRHVVCLGRLQPWIRANQRRAFLLAGDFNTTPYSAFSEAVAEWVDDAWDLAGEGFGHSAPNGLKPLPPMRLDHVYMPRSLTVVEARLGEGPGSDHRPLFLTVGRRDGAPEPAALDSPPDLPSDDRY